MKDQVSATVRISGNEEHVTEALRLPDAKEQEMAVCWCRKPRIGNIVEAAVAMGKMYPEYYPPHMALFVGDRDEDRQCSENAGIRFMLASEWRKLSDVDSKGAI